MFRSFRQWLAVAKINTEPNVFERFSRQIILQDMGVAGQKRLGQASVVLAGDPSIVEQAALYLSSAGVGVITRKADSSIPASEAVASMSGKSGNPAMRGRALREGSAVGTGALPAPSPLADQAMLLATGMLLAIEVIKQIVGIGAAECVILKFTNYD